MGKVAERFVEDITNLSDSEKYIFYYADNHIEQVKNITLTNLAEILNTSNTTIIRMCHKLGLQGFSEFKFILASFSNQKKDSRKRESQRRLFGPADPDHSRH